MLNLLITIFISFLILIIWGFLIEPNILCVKKYNIKEKRLKGLRAVMVGDTHFRPNQIKKLKKVVDKICSQNADILFIVGDLTNGYSEKASMPISKIIEEFNRITPKYGKYAVLGNHDWWYGGEKIISELETNGIKVLHNKNTFVNIGTEILYIAGVEDYCLKNPDVSMALQGAKEPVIMLTHSPDTFVNIPKIVTLTLAGHTHGCQARIPFIPPIIVPSDYGMRFLKSYVEEDGKKMIVTKGIGESKIYARFNCIPEIVTITFE